METTLELHTLLQNKSVRYLLSTSLKVCLDIEIGGERNGDGEKKKEFFGGML